MARHPTRNRVVAGAFLLLMAAAAVVILIIVAGWQYWFEPMQTLRVRFDAAPNIKIGGPVLLAGHPVGRVGDIQIVEVPCPVERKPEDKCYVVEVTAELPKRYRVYQNARVTISQALVGQSAVINVENVGYGDPVKEFLKGKQESPFAGAADELGIGEDQKQDVSEILKNIRAVTADVREGLPEILAKLKATTANLAEVSESVKGTVKRVDTVLDENRENLKATVANAREATDTVKKKADEVLENLKDATAKLEAIVDENRPDIRETVTHAKSVMAKADSSASEILANVKAASAGLKAGIEDFRVVASNAKAVVETNRTRIAKTMQNFHETSDHLKALAKEVRRAPWRLFATPDKEEVESINLYDTARAFAATASDLDSVTDTLQAMMEAKAKGFEVPQEVFDEMLKHLRETYEQYGKAEDALLKEFERIQK